MVAAMHFQAVCQPLLNNDEGAAMLLYYKHAGPTGDSSLVIVLAD